MPYGFTLYRIRSMHRIHVNGVLASENLDSYDYYLVPTVSYLFNLSCEYGGYYISVDEISKMASNVILVTPWDGVIGCSPAEIE